MIWGNTHNIYIFLALLITKYIILLRVVRKINISSYEINFEDVLKIKIQIFKSRLMSKPCLIKFNLIHVVPYGLQLSFYYKYKSYGLKFQLIKVGIHTVSIFRISIASSC